MLKRLWRRKSDYLVAIAVLALGIGTSVAMFTLVDAVVLRPLPFPSQDAIHVVWKSDALAGDHIEELAYPELHDLEGLDSLDYAAVMPPSLYGYGKVLQVGSSKPVQIEGAPVSHDFFRVLGVSPALGRDFSADDERVGAAPVVVLSHEVWRDHLGSDPGIIGEAIRLNGQHSEVIGVMAPGVDFPRGAGMWVPLGVREWVVQNRDATFLQAIVRTKPGVTREEISRDVDVLFGRLAAEHPLFYSESQRGVVTPLAEYWTGSARVHLWILLTASLLLLAASLMSAGHLLLSAIVARRPEIATRLALGASPGRVFRELSFEGIAVAGVAAGLGLLIARAAVDILVATSVADIPRLSQAAVDLRSFGFASGAAALAALTCTVVPAWFVARWPVASTLRSAGARTSRSRGDERTTGLFVLTQALVTVALLVLAVLLSISYRAMLAADTGFAHRDTVTMNLALRGAGASPGQRIDVAYRRSFYERLLESMRAEPGVSSAAAILLRPLEGNVGWDVSYEFAFAASSRARDDVLPKANYEVITPDYFRTVGTPLLAGRDFTERDTEDAPPVIIISNALAERIREAGHPALGHRIRLGLGSGEWNEVIGVAADARYRGITKTGADLFVPHTQARQPTNYVVVRGSRPEAELVEIVSDKLATLDPEQALAGVATLGALMDRDAGHHRFNGMLLLLLGACAAALASAGVYGVIAESTAMKERELAIRSALGAPRQRIVRDVITRTLVFVVLGESMGLLVAVVLGSLATELLYGTSARDPAVLGAVAVFVFAISLWSAFWPAWSATRGAPRLS